MDKKTTTKKHHLKMYTLGEEIFNSVTHGVGAIFGVVVTIIMIIYTSLNRDAWCVVSACVFGATLIALYTMSTLYHAITNPTAKKVFRSFDHSTIFLLIAGSYTPYALVTMRQHTSLGWVVFGIVWGSAIIGVILNSISVEKFKKPSMILYLASGWAVVIAMKPLIDYLPRNGLLLLFLGGVFYTGGIIFYKMKHKKYFHSIWHIFVLAGSVSHFFSIMFYVYMQ